VELEGVATVSVPTTLKLPVTLPEASVAAPDVDTVERVVLPVTPSVPPTVVLFVTAKEVGVVPISTIVPELFVKSRLSTVLMASSPVDKSPVVGTAPVVVERLMRMSVAIFHSCFGREQ
jgi:hypothetical protein